MFHTLRNSDGLASPGPGSVWRNENSADSFNINRFITYACCFLLLLIGNSPRAQSADITSMEFSEDGIRPALAASASGEFMLLFTRVRWDLVNQSQGGSPVVPPTHLFGRLFQADGAPKGDAFDVYTGAAFTGDAVVRSDQNGNFTCYWSIAPRSTPPGNSKPIIYSRRFDSNGRARTEAQSLITTGTEVEGNRILMTFDADMSPDGKSVVVWSESVDLYDAKSVIYAQRFDTRGRKAGPVIHVTTPEPPPNQSKTEVSVSMDDDGAFAVAWLHRYFPDFPSAELDIDLEVAVFEPDGRVQESHVVLRHEDLPFGHGHKDTRIKKVAGYGYVVMTNHTTRPELEVGESISDKLYSSTFEGRFYPDGEAPSEIFSSDVFEVKGRSIFDLTIAASGKIGLVFEDIQSEVKVTRFAEINSDFTDVLSVQILNANGELSPQSEALPVIQAKPNGTYIYAVTAIPDDYVTTRRQFLRGGFIRPNHIVDDISKSLSFELVENKMFSIWFESTQGKTYRLLNGGELDALEEIEIIRGTGQRISRQYPFSLGFEFFAVTED